MLCKSEQDYIVVTRWKMRANESAIERRLECDVSIRSKGGMWARAIVRVRSEVRVDSMPPKGSGMGRGVDLRSVGAPTLGFGLSNDNATSFNDLARGAHEFRLVRSG